MPFDNSLKNMQTPGRVHALCKLLLINDYSMEKLLELLQPESTEQEQSRAVLKLATNGGLVVIGEDKKVNLQVPESEVLDRERFQHYVAKLAFQNSEYIFGRFTAWVMTRGEKVIKESKDQLAERFFDEVSRHKKNSQEFNSTNILAWQSWANYFGLGHTMTGVFIPNPSTRIKTVLKYDDKLPKGKFIPFQTFMKWLADNCPELDGGKLNLQFNDQFTNQRISFALSLALRTLHDLGIITLKHTRDVEDIWFLHEVSTHEIPDQVTDILVKG
jgi:hypothetical protein